MAGELNIALAVLGAIAVGGAAYALASPATTPAKPLPPPLKPPIGPPQPPSAVQTFALRSFLSTPGIPADLRVLQSLTPYQLTLGPAYLGLQGPIAPSYMAQLQALAMRTDEIACLSLDTAIASVQATMTATPVLPPQPPANAPPPLPPLPPVSACPIPLPSNVAQNISGIGRALTAPERMTLGRAHLLVAY
jgi:hypothetical protein